MSTLQTHDTALYEENLATVPMRPWRHPLEIATASATDFENYITFPALYPHLVRFSGEDGCDQYAVRMRDAVGQLRLLSEPVGSEAEGLRELKAYWGEISLCLTDGIIYEADRHFYKVCEEIAKVERACLSRPCDPAWSSPFGMINRWKFDKDSAATDEGLPGRTLTEAEFKAIPHYCPYVAVALNRNGVLHYSFQCRQPERNIKFSFNFDTDLDLIKRRAQGHLLRAGFSLAMHRYYHSNDDNCDFRAFRRDNAVNLARSSLEAQNGPDDEDEDDDEFEYVPSFGAPR